MNLIPVSNSDEMIIESGSVESNCLEITFINLGTDVCTVLGKPLQQNQQLYLPGKVGTVDVTNYNVKFEQEAGRTQKLLVIRNRYTKLD